jgi:putative membrane protein
MLTLRFLLAVAHLLALGIGIAAVHGRGRALRRVRTSADLPAVLYADNWYGAAAVLWIATGLWRAFGGVEKGTDYYLGSHWFMGKLGLFGIVLLLELLPMITLIRWRMALKQGKAIPLERAPLLATLSTLQVPLLLLMVLMAAAMARGL